MVEDKKTIADQEVTYGPEAIAILAGLDPVKPRSTVNIGLEYPTGINRNDPARYAAAFALQNMMGALSEENWTAAWLHDLEYRLWEEVVGERAKAGFEATPRQREILKLLAEESGGWWFCNEDCGRQFIETDAWAAKYAAWKTKARRQGGEAPRSDP